MDFSNLEYFRAVAKYENLTRAAKELYISEPGLSKYITRLERQIGVPLFDRRKGRIVLNAYGQMFRDCVNEAFSSLEHGVSAVRSAYSQKQNVLSVACSIEDFLTDRIKEFAEEHPEIRIRQYRFSISEIENGIVNKTLDLAICANPPANEKIKYEVLSQCPFILVCNRDNPLSVQREMHLKVAENEHFICDCSRFSRSQIEYICQLCGFSPIISHEIESSYILKSLLDSNAGVALMPLAHFMKFTAGSPDNQLCAIKLKDDLPKAEIGVFYLSEEYLSAAANLFFDFLRRWTKQESVRMESFAEELFAQ